MSKNRVRPPAPAQQNFATRRDELTSLPLDQRFEKIFRTNLWGAEDSRSGLGSELDATGDLRAALPAFLERHQAESLLDIPCGDFNWMSTLGLQLPYTGADIVAAIVEANERRFGGRIAGAGSCGSISRATRCHTLTSSCAATAWCTCPTRTSSAHSSTCAAAAHGIC
jgi:hypothetical protein